MEELQRARSSYHLVWVFASPMSSRCLPETVGSAAACYEKAASRTVQDAVTEITTTVLDRFWLRIVSCLPYLSFLFMVYSAGNAIYETKGDRGTVFFVGSSFTLLGLLYWCMHEFQKIRDIPSPKNRLLKIAVWLLSVALTVLFSYRVTTILDSTALSVFVWTVSMLTSLLGFYFLFM